jgi:uncharacterized Zn-binding protein involved in type VI secretion
MGSIIRAGDPISCGDIMANGSTNVFINGLGVTRIGIDLTAGHCFSPVPVIAGSTSVFVNGVGIARMGDPIQNHCCPDHGCHDGFCVGGSLNTFTG